jgi:hypothetical protein
MLCRLSVQIDHLLGVDLEIGRRKSPLAGKRIECSRAQAWSPQACARIFYFYDVSDFLYRDHRLGGGTDHRLYAWRLDSSSLAPRPDYLADRIPRTAQSPLSAPFI